MKKGNKIGLYIIISFVIILGIGIICFVNSKNNLDNYDTKDTIFSKTIKDEVITADNYDEIMDKIEQELKKDEELYYLSYSLMYYITKDGLASAFTNPDDESAMYVNIYGKTVKQLIEEGKQLMIDNNITIEEYKQQIKTLNSTEQ